MNSKIAKSSSIINVCAVLGFALSLLTGFSFGSYISSIFIAFSFVLMICAFASMGKPETKTAGNAAMIFAAIYAVFILTVYFTQVTTVRLENLSEQTINLLDYTAFGLFFNFNLLGYSMMAVSTFFIALTLEANTKADKALKYLLLFHGLYAITSFAMPMFGVFNSEMQGTYDWIGTVILLFWCVHFLPIGVLSFVYYKSRLFQISGNTPRV